MPEKVVLAYSGGLDTSIIIPWLKENYSCEVIAMVADVGQGDDIDAVVEKAYKTGASKVVVEDLREEFLTGYVFPALQAGAVYEHKYLLGTSMARPVIAKHQVEVALREGATALAHGCSAATMKCNSSVNSGWNSSCDSLVDSVSARSMRCCSSACTSSGVSPGSIEMACSGKLSLNSRNTTGMMCWHAVVLPPIRSRPLPHLPSCASDSRADSISARIFSVCFKSCSPACVSTIFLPNLSKRRHPISVSKAFIE